MFWMPGISISAALDSAHRAGFLHRDLKPGNIALTVDGQPKILDFGLALLLSSAVGAGHLTQTGMIVGSLPYMAPEQLLGEADDARTDIYALGVMLFEMATGQRPLAKERTALMFAIINTTAPSARTIRPDIPSAAQEAPASPSIRAIAVLPLRNVAGDPAQEYFVDGMTEAIISDLSRWSNGTNRLAR